MNKNVNAAQVTNGAEEIISHEEPFFISVTIQGAADILMHRWNNETIEAKSKAKKGSAAKKSDDLESYVYRNEVHELCMPGENLRQSIIMAAKYHQDPRSPRKSAMDLYKAGIVATTLLAPFGKGLVGWDYEDRRRVMIQRNGVTRVRPAMRAGWKLSFEFMINLPEYIGANDLRAIIEQAGRLIGIGDFRPTFGRFGIVNYSVRED